MRKIARRLAIALMIVAAAFVLVFHPSRPLYMRHEDVRITSSDGVMLAGTLSLPRWARQPVPGVVLVHGSGPLTRENFRGDVRRLVRQGIAVLTYDKRGVGESGGTYASGWGDDAEAVLRTLAQDAAAVFEALRRHEDIDSSRAGFFGASQAGWIIPLAAEQLDSKPRFHIILSGAAVSTGVEGHYSRLTGDGRRPPRLADPVAIRQHVDLFTGPAGFDPAPLLRRLDVPTLWLLGERDESVPTFASVRVLEAIRASGNRSHTVIVYEDANHGLRKPDGESAPIWTDLRRWLVQIGVIGGAP